MGNRWMGIGLVFVLVTNFILYVITNVNDYKVYVVITAFYGVIFSTLDIIKFGYFKVMMKEEGKDGK